MLLCALGVLAGCASTKVQPSVMTAAVKGDISPTNPGWNVFTWGKG